MLNTFRIQTYKRSVNLNTGINLTYRQQIANGSIHTYPGALKYKDTVVNGGIHETYAQAIANGDVKPYKDAFE